MDIIQGKIEVSAGLVVTSTFSKDHPFGLMNTCQGKDLRVLDFLNDNMEVVFTPGWILCLNESMSY